MIQSFKDVSTKELFETGANRRWAGIRVVTALRLARFFGNSPEFWLNFQQMHDLSKARIELSKTIERDVVAFAGA